MSATFRLPWPPSVNRYWRHVGGKTLLSKTGREYKARAVAMLERQKRVGFTTFQDSVGVALVFHAPDSRKRDLDNYFKALFDCVTDSGVWKDDSIVGEIHAYRGGKVRGGEVFMTIWKR